MHVHINVHTLWLIAASISYFDNNVHESTVHWIDTDNLYLDIIRLDNFLWMKVISCATEGPSLPFIHASGVHIIVSVQ